MKKFLIIDEKIFNAVYGFGTKTNAVKAAAVITRLSQPVFMVIFAAGAAASFIYNGAVGGILYCLCAFVCLVVNTAARKLIGRKRPFVKMGIEKYIEHETSGSFPSNHAASAMVIAVGWAAVNVYAAVCFVLLAAVTGISRVMVGVHYPADVLAGWIAGGAFGALSVCLFLCGIF